MVYRLDLISRNIGDFAELIEDLGDRHIDFISIREQFDTSSPMGRAMMYIASVFSQLERENIAERIRDNMYELSKTGRWLGGTTPTGYASERLSSLTVDGKANQIRPMEGWIVAVGKHPGIIAGSDWVRVQAMLDVNKSTSMGALFRMAHSPPVTSLSPHSYGSRVVRYSLRLPLCDMQFADVSRTLKSQTAICKKQPARTSAGDGCCSGGRIRSSVFQRQDLAAVFSS